MLLPADMIRLSEHIMWVSDVLCLSAVTIRGLEHDWLELHSVEQRHANTHRLFLKLCWLMDKHALKFQQKRFRTASITDSSLGTGRDSVTKRSGVSFPGIARRVCSYPLYFLGVTCVTDLPTSVSSNFAISYTIPTEINSNDFGPFCI